jgi:hypothetical protein
MNQTEIKGIKIEIEKVIKQEETLLFFHLNSHQVKVDLLMTLNM